MKRENTDILISGGGVAGLTAAAAFGTAGFRVILVDPAPPITDGDDANADLRTTAFLQPARDLLEDAGIWARLADDAMPLQTMRIVDASGAAPVTRDFAASDIGDGPFGWNLRNWMLRRDILSRLAELPQVQVRTGVGFSAMVPREMANIVTLTDGQQIDARLVIGADGRDSPVRTAAGIGTKTTRYGQKAITFAVTHDLAHDNISTEIHQRGGPFTLVPLPDHHGRPCSAVVWMTDSPEAERLAALPIPAFEQAAVSRSAALYGALTLATRRQVWPIITRLTDRLNGPRTALMAEAAHVMPPIGAQGLNTSLADLRLLLKIAQDAPEQLGNRAGLARYNRERHADIVLRSTGISMLNRTSQTGQPVLQALRKQGMQMFHDVAPIRKTLMRMGLGAR